MPRVDMEDAKASFQEILPKIPDRYKRKIRKARWKEAAASDEAEALWAAKVAEAATRKRRAKAIEKISEEDWKSAADQLGSKRIKESLEVKGLKRWEARWRPYAEVLNSLTLPPRSADPYENIDKRVKAVVEALVRKKSELLGE